MSAPKGLPWWLIGKESACQNAGDPGSIPGLGKSPGRRHGNPLQYSCLENPMDRRARGLVYRVIDGETVGTVSDFIFLGSKITADGDCSHEIKDTYSWEGKL